MEHTQSSKPNGAANGVAMPLAPVSAIPATTVQPTQVIASDSPQVAATPTVAELLAMIETLKAQVAAGDAEDFRITDKGGVSVYGLGRFPVTLYQEQWDKLIGVSEANPGMVVKLRAYLATNRSKLSTKPVKETKK